MGDSPSCVIPALVICSPHRPQDREGTKRQRITAWRAPTYGHHQPKQQQPSAKASHARRLATVVSHVGWVPRCRRVCVRGSGACMPERARRPSRSLRRHANTMAPQGNPKAQLHTINGRDTLQTSGAAGEAVDISTSLSLIVSPAAAAPCRASIWALRSAATRRGEEGGRRGVGGVVCMWR